MPPPRCRSRFSVACLRRIGRRRGAGNDHERGRSGAGSRPRRFRRWRRWAAASRPPPPSGPGNASSCVRGSRCGYLAREYGVTKQAIIEANHLTPPEYKIEIGKDARHPRRASRGRRRRRPPAAIAAESRRRRPPSARRRRPARKARRSHPARRTRCRRRGNRRGSGDRLSAAGAPARRASCLRPPPNGPRPPADPAEKERRVGGGRAGSTNGGHFPWPVRGRVLAGYGATKEGGQNAGINIAASRGAPVRAVDSGVVAYAGNEIRGYGNLVLVKHPNGLIRPTPISTRCSSSAATRSARPSHREGRRYRRGQRAAAAFRAAPRQEGGRSARIPGSRGANAGGSAKRRPEAEMPEPEWHRLNRLHWEDRVAIHLGPRGYDLDRLRAGQEPAQQASRPESCRRSPASGFCICNAISARTA